MEVGKASRTLALILVMWTAGIGCAPTYTSIGTVLDRKISYLSEGDTVYRNKSNGDIVVVRGNSKQLK